jgi:hypothetical protein
VSSVVQAQGSESDNSGGSAEKPSMRTQKGSEDLKPSAHIKVPWSNMPGTRDWLQRQCAGMSNAEAKRWMMVL